MASDATTNSLVTHTGKAEAWGTSSRTAPVPGPVPSCLPAPKPGFALGTPWVEHWGLWVRRAEGGAKPGERGNASRLTCVHARVHVWGARVCACVRHWGLVIEQALLPGPHRALQVSAKMLPPQGRLPWPVL